MKLIPKNDYIVVKELPKSSVSSSGIILPVEEDDEAQTSHCEVVEVCPGSEYKKGQIVLFSKLVPDDVQVKTEKGDMEKYWFVKETDIKAVLEK